MILNWVYDPNTRISKVAINSELYYTTNDGGQTIHKYINNELVDTFHKYGPDLKFSNVASSNGTHITLDDTTIDMWPDEVLWLSKTYPEIVGPLDVEYNSGFLNVNGEIEDVGKKRGMGILSPDKPISINRICQPASVQEGWDYEVIAESDEDVDSDCGDGGTLWVKHKTTGQIYRKGRKQPYYPCCVFPQIHGPWPVDESDIAKYNGKPIK